MRHFLVLTAIATAVVMACTHLQTTNGDYPSQGEGPFLENWTLPTFLFPKTFPAVPLDVRNLAILEDETQNRIQRSLDVSQGIEIIQELDSAWSKTDFAKVHQLTRQFIRHYEEQIEDAAFIAGSVYRQGREEQRLLDRLGINISEDLRRQALDRIAREGYSEEMKDLMRTRGYNESQINELRNFTASHLDYLAKQDIIQVHDRLRDQYISAILNQSERVTLEVLGNSLLTYRQKKAVGEPNLTQLKKLDALKSKTQCGSASRQLMNLTLELAEQTGDPGFARVYVNATLFWASWIVDSFGDSEGASAASTKVV